jgi:hypothetical protein
MKSFEILRTTSMSEVIWNLNRKCFFAHKKKFVCREKNFRYHDITTTSATAAARQQGLLLLEFKRSYINYITAVLCDYK